jgi:hypothetical protein
LAILALVELSYFAVLQRIKSTMPRARSAPATTAPTAIPTIVPVERPLLHCVETVTVSDVADALAALVVLFARRGQAAVGEEEKTEIVPKVPESTGATATTMVPSVTVGGTLSWRDAPETIMLPVADR